MVVPDGARCRHLRTVLGFGLLGDGRGNSGIRAFRPAECLARRVVSAGGWSPPLVLAESAAGATRRTQVLVSLCQATQNAPEIGTVHRSSNPVGDTNPWITYRFGLGAGLTTWVRKLRMLLAGSPMRPPQPSESPGRSTPSGAFVFRVSVAGIRH